MASSSTHIRFAEPQDNRHNARIHFTEPHPHTTHYHTSLSPLYARRALHRAQKAHSSGTTTTTHTPQVTPLNIWLVETHPDGNTHPTPNQLPWETRPGITPFLKPPYPGSPISDEFPLCPITHPHLHSEQRAYFHRNQRPHQREMRMLREFENGDFWEGGNPPPKVWDALWCVLGDEGGEEEQEIIYAYRYWHCPRYRLVCVREEGRERMGLEGRLERIVEEGLWVGDGEESEGVSMRTLL